ncbi:MAG: hypothetical protein QXT26_02410 [Thermoproteota archaeon]
MCGSRKISVEAPEEPREVPVQTLDDKAREELLNALVDYIILERKTDRADYSRLEGIFLHPRVKLFYGLVKEVAGESVSLEEFINAIVIAYFTRCLKVRPLMIFGDRTVKVGL